DTLRVDVEVHTASTSVERERSALHLAARRIEHDELVRVGNVELVFGLIEGNVTHAFVLRAGNRNRSHDLVCDGIPLDDPSRTHLITDAHVPRTGVDDRTNRAGV